MRAISPRSLGRRDTLNHCHQQHDCHSPPLFITPRLSGLSIGTLYGLHAWGKHCWTIHVVFVSVESLVDAYQMIIFPRPAPSVNAQPEHPFDLAYYSNSQSQVPPNRCFDRINAQIMSRDTDGSSYVHPNINPWTSISKESSLPTCWSLNCVFDSYGGQGTWLSGPHVLQ